MRSASLAALALALVSGDVRAGEAEVFGTWVAGCDTLRICEAVTALPAASGDRGAPPVLLRIRHGPDAGLPPTLTVIDPSNRPDWAGRMVRTAQLTVRWAKGSVRYRAVLDGAGHYRFADADVDPILQALLAGYHASVRVGTRRALATDAGSLHDALAHFDREQMTVDRAGALVLRPGAVMFDHVPPPPPPPPPRYRLTVFSEQQLQEFLSSRWPDGILPSAHVLSRPIEGTVAFSDLRSPAIDCGVLELWGHADAPRGFVLLQRREMPVCTGIVPSGWVRTYHADWIGSEAGPTPPQGPLK